MPRPFEKCPERVWLRPSLDNVHVDHRTLVRKGFTTQQNMKTYFNYKNTNHDLNILYIISCNIPMFWKKPKLKQEKPPLFSKARVPLGPRLWPAKRRGCRRNANEIDPVSEGPGRRTSLEILCRGQVVLFTVNSSWKTFFFSIKFEGTWNYMPLELLGISLWSPGWLLTPYERNFS